LGRAADAFIVTLRAMLLIHCAAVVGCQSRAASR